MPEGSREQLKQGLEDDQLIVNDAGVLRTTRRWQAAMARAAYRLLHQGEASEDIRMPMLLALMELYPDLDDEALATLVEIMLPLEVHALDPGEPLARPVEL